MTPGQAAGSGGAKEKPSQGRRWLVSLGVLALLGGLLFVSFQQARKGAEEFIAKSGKEFVSDGWRFTLFQSVPGYTGPCWIFTLKRKRRVPNGSPCMWGCWGRSRVRPGRA